MMLNAIARALRAPLVGLLSASLSIGPALAQLPVATLSDLVNRDSNYAQRELQRRGYVFIHADQRGSKTWQYWWLPGPRECARVAHVDGRAISLVGVAIPDCNQQVEQASGDSKGMSTGAKVAIGAAALLGVAMLVHKSHERDEQKHNDEQKTAEYERGYRDGLYHQPYHDYNRTQSYVDGYNAGQQKREAETSYRSNYGHHTGQASYVNLNDLVGARASSGDGEMQRRGFQTTGGYQAKGKSYTTWWNGNTRQCVKVVTHEGRFNSISPLHEGNCT